MECKYKNHNFFSSTNIGVYSGHTFSIPKECAEREDEASKNEFSNRVASIIQIINGMEYEDAAELFFTEINKLIVITKKKLIAKLKTE